jgi:hypothetical protein
MGISAVPRGRRASITDVIPSPAMQTAESASAEGTTATSTTTSTMV